MDRRKFLKTLGITGGCALASSTVKANEAAEDVEFNAVLIDTTRCVGCRTCEMSCAEAHGLPIPEDLDDSVFEEERKTSTEQWTVVNRYQTGAGEIFRKDQCMHCAQPACAAACLTKAMYKTEQGPVIWRPDKCMGCRYCMVSCPFDVPKFEYEKAAPTIQKCNQCFDRFQEGEIPACVENCPAEALMFGRKRDLVEIARQRIYENPDDYEHHIYGEREAGGTGVMYLSSVPFDEIGLRTDLETVPYPEFSKGFLYSVPLILLLWPAILLGINKARGQGNGETGAEGDDEL